MFLQRQGQECKELKTKCPTIHEDILKQIIEKLTFNEVEIELKFCEKHKVEVITYNNKNYPVRLHLLEDKPLVLYKRGDIFPKIKRSLAIVGTRKSTE